ncbi:hypothetical protein [Clostridium guangxiense]|uniref:hypothetical protein n=1 Tax=Clostridium guangxiense TaxID=1662055 RepID=UPI001E50AF8A|nr:hypothetical protein [Clostridium guangxiense]MCD2347396.1 hypothetical protein [Clostridium guangxiense]
MSDENKYSEEQAPDEVLEENKSEQESKEEATEEMLEELTDVTSEKIPFPRVIYSVFVDQVVLFALSGILLLITGFVLKNVFYFYIKDVTAMYFLIYAICNILYTLIMLGSKKNATVGYILGGFKISK